MKRRRIRWLTMLITLAAFGLQAVPLGASPVTPLCCPPGGEEVAGEFDDQPCAAAEAGFPCAPCGHCAMPIQLGELALPPPAPAPSSLLSAPLDPALPRVFHPPRSA